ncbi:5'/3'-nucleotidase SurE [Dialister pneumosintes]|nr:5'/3'-nucleotidase SurE [Dialister pneumosintes]
MRKMNVLMTNDDGYEAPGIKALASAISEFARITVVAPDRERSSCSGALTLREYISLKEQPSYGANIQVFSCGGMTADCCKIAIEGLLVNDKPDLILSGANRGYNIGTDCLYSGTVAGAMEGCVFGIPSMAVSLERINPEHFLLRACKFTVELVKEIFVKNQYKGTLNLNIPYMEQLTLNKLKLVDLGLHRYKNAIKVITDTDGNQGYWIGGEPEIEIEPKNTDIYWIHRNKVTLTPLGWDMTAYNEQKIIHNIVKNHVDEF